MPSAEPVPIACTLDTRAMGARIAEIQRFTRAYLRFHHMEGRVLRLTYAAAATAELARIVELERVCCAFLDFTIHASPDTVELTITTPERDGDDARWLFAHFLPATAEDAAASEGNGCACCR